MLRRLSGRYGRRGAWLIVLGAVWMLFGVGVTLDPQPPRSWVAYDYVWPWLQAAAWVLTGAIAVQQGFRGPHANDWVGHVALYVMPAVRVISFALSWILWLCSSILTPDHVIGWSGGWYAGLVWSLVSVMLRLIADWPNPVRPIPHPPAGATGGS